VTKHGYRLIPLPFAEALALESLERPPEDNQQPAKKGEIVLERIQTTLIPAFTYSIEPPVPDKPLATLGTRLLLVAHKHVPGRAALELVQATYASDSDRSCILPWMPSSWICRRSSPGMRVPWSINSAMLRCSPAR
jgi:hypothetical protein